MQRLLAFTSVLILATAALLISTRLLGRIFRTQAEANVDAGACSQPCWNGIRPGETTIDQANIRFDENATLAAVPGTGQFDNERCWDMTEASPLALWKACAVYWYADDHKISLVRLVPQQGAFELGDAVALFGEPLASTLCWWDARLPNMPSQFLRARVYFRSGVEVWAYSLRQPMRFVFDPGMVVYTVNYHNRVSELPAQSDTPRWQGFKRFQRQVGC